MAAADHLGEQFTLYHGTRAKLSVGDHIRPWDEVEGGQPNYSLYDTSGLTFASSNRASAGKYARMARGEGAPRVYQVEPTGPVHRDTAGNKHAYYSEHPLRITGTY